MKAAEIRQALKDEVLEQACLAFWNSTKTTAKDEIRSIIVAALAAPPAQAQEPTYTELQYQHARMQSHADGFQTGWHAALKRMGEGDRIHDLRELVPEPTVAPAPAQERTEPMNVGTPLEGTAGKPQTGDAVRFASGTLPTVSAPLAGCSCCECQGKRCLMAHPGHSCGRSRYVAPAPAQEPGKSCIWTEDEDGPWHTECGHSFEFIEGTPFENKQRFCGYCGGQLREMRIGERRKRGRANPAPPTTPSPAPLERDTVFSCPACGDPSARTTEPDCDIHSGATYHCDQCGAAVIFTAQTAEQYSAPAPQGAWQPEAEK